MYKLLIATLIGFLLGILIIFLLFQDTTLYKGPNAKETSEKIFMEDNYCYKMTPYIVLSYGKHV